MKPTVGLTKIFLGRNGGGNSTISANVYGQRVVFEKHEDFEGDVKSFFPTKKSRRFPAMRDANLGWEGKREWE
jgi:hypothetical protein